MLPRKKRAHDIIDLTGDDFPLPKTKNQRTAAPSSSVRSMQSSQGSSYQNNSAPSYSYSTSSNGSSQRLVSQQHSLFDDELDLMDLTQADDGPVLQHYGDIDNKIVGVRFYNGLVSPGEVVVLRRDPMNM